MSYIEKEKLIKADIVSIENIVRHAFNQGYDLGFKVGKEKAKPQEQEPRWIPISERLPKAYEFVNCTCHSLIDDREDWVIETCYIPQLPNSPYSDWGNIPMLNSCECEVIAWMHRDIPKPYKGESEDT